jgi:anhydro-N-acetylmuramic acid kinase
MTMPDGNWYVGLMSGTSADGIDAAAVRFEDGSGADFSVAAFESIDYPKGLREEILEVCDPQLGTVDRVCRLDAVLGEWFARAALKVIKSAGLKPSDVRAIGSHGQTVHHQPDEVMAHGVSARSTLQIGNASIIAERTGIQTVSDFRSRDIAVGGQGAPLVPLVDYLLFRSESEGRVLVNIGGISNVTVLPPACSLDDVMAFDTGPGNVIIDGLVSRHTDGQASFDQDGRIAGGATVQSDLLERWLSHPFFELAPPKSTGREMFGMAHVDRIIQDHPSVEMTDLIATATAFTAASLVSSLKCFAPDYNKLAAIYVSGGGSANPTLMREMQDRLSPLPVRVTDDLGLAADAKEAVAFALLAYRTVNGLPGNVPAATGAERAVVLGQLTAAPA